MEQLDMFYDDIVEDDLSETEEVTIGSDLPENCFYRISTPKGVFDFYAEEDYESPYHALGELFTVISYSGILDSSNDSGFRMEWHPE